MNHDYKWKHRFEFLWKTCQCEFKKTSAIGRKMLKATRLNSSLKELYEDLGHLSAKAIKKGDPLWEDPTALELVRRIEHYEADLAEMENEIKAIKDQVKVPLRTVEPSKKEDFL